MDFDYAVATPDVMGVVGKFAKFLGHVGCCQIKKWALLLLMLVQLLLILKKVVCSSKMIKVA